MSPDWLADLAELWFKEKGAESCAQLWKSKTTKNENGAPELWQKLSIWFESRRGDNPWLDRHLLRKRGHFEIFRTKHVQLACLVLRAKPAEA